MTELVELTAAQQALARVETAGEAKALYDQIEAIAQYAKRYRLDHVKQNEIAEAKLRTARKGGELLAATPLFGRDKDVSRDATRLPEGFSRSMSSRWQSLARLNPDDFEDFLRNTDEITLAAALNRAGRGERDRSIRARREHAERLAAEAIAADPNACNLEHADITAWRPAGVDAIITDPPYITDNAVELHRQLGDFAVDVLPDGGALAILTWQPLLPAVIQVLDRPELVYRWMAAWIYETSARTPERKPRVFDGWKPILVYHKTRIPDDVGYLYDTVKSPDADKDHHEWGQSPEGFMQLVRAFTEPGERVCDPFLGGGTTAVAALAETRRFIGADIDANAIDITQARIAT